MASPPPNRRPSKLANRAPAAPQAPICVCVRSADCFLEAQARGELGACEQQVRRERTLRRLSVEERCWERELLPVRMDAPCAVSSELDFVAKRPS